jgi:hypothetical protein
MQVPHTAPRLAPFFGQRSILEDLNSEDIEGEKKKKLGQHMQATK